MQARADVVADAQSGKVVKLRGSVQDITEHKRAEAELRGSEERYRLLFEKNPQPMWVFDSQTLRFLEVNGAAIAHYGYSRDEFLSMTILDVRPAEDVPALLESVKHDSFDLLTGQSWRHCKKDGIVIDVEIASHTFTLDGIPAKLVLANDITERKQAEEALSRSEERYRELVENAIDIIYTQDLEGNYTSINKAGERITGFTREESLARNLRQAVAPEYRNKAKEMTAAKLAGLERTAYELEIIAKNGDRVPVEVNTRIVYKDGVAVGVQGIARDITERKLAQAALTESEERYRELVENALDIIYTHDLKGNYTSANKAAETITGYTNEEALAMNIADTVAPEHLEKAKKMIAAKLAGEEVTAYELELVAKDGHPVTVEVNTRIIYENDVPVGVQGIARDITERKRAATALADLDERYRDVVENAIDIIYTHDLEGNYTSVNKAIKKITGYTPEEATKMNMVDIVAPADLDYARSMFAALLAGDREPVTELGLITKSGGSVTVEINSRLMYENDVPVGVQGIAREVTERVRAQTEARQLLSVLEGTLNEIYIFDADTLRFEYVNACAKRIWGTRWTQCAY